NYNGSDTVNLTVTDEVGGVVATGAAGTGTSDTGTVAITINAVNDQVLISDGDAKIISEDSAGVTLTGLSISDVDAVLNPSGQYSVTLPGAQRTLNAGAH